MGKQKREPKSFKIKSGFVYSKADEMSGQDAMLQKIYDAVSHPIDADTVYMYSKNYEKIFGKPLKETDRKSRFMKITNVQTGKSVYRTFRGVSSGVLSSDTIYMDSDGRNILEGFNEDLENKNTDVQVPLAFKKAGWLSYYWHTSNTMVRITFRLGIVSFLLGLVSLVVGIIPFIKVVK